MNETIDFSDNEVVLELQEYTYASAYARDIPVPKLYVKEDIELGLTKLMLIHKIPTKIIQDDRVICRYPASNWDWFKKFIPGLKPKYRVHTVNEHLTFPGIQIPKSRLKDKLRIFFEDRSYIDD